MKCSIYPSFVRETDAREIYLEHADMPPTLLPRIANLLPIHFEDPAFMRNLQLRSGGDQPSFVEAVPRMYMDWFMAPHIIYTPVLYMLLNMDPPQSDNKKLFRRTTTIFEVAKFYRCVLFYFQHSALVETGPWEGRARDIFERYDARVTQDLRMFQKTADAIAGLDSLRMAYDLAPAGTPLVAQYDEKIAKEYREKSFVHCTHIVTAMELALYELLQMNPRDVDIWGACVQRLHPPLAQVEQVTLDVAEADLLRFADDMCNAHVQEDQYDLEHIKMRGASESDRSLLSPSFFFQTFVFVTRAHVHKPPTASSSSSS